jgi:hypothetical protein
MIKQKLFENFAHPRGLWGHLAGQVMAHMVIGHRA